jgi:hypothetical protein
MAGYALASLRMTTLFLSFCLESTLRASPAGDWEPYSQSRNLFLGDETINIELTLLSIKYAIIKENIRRE